MAETQPFTGFGPPARLYAKHAAVVDQMRDLFRADVKRFLDAVRDRVESLVPTVPFHEYRDKADLYRWWWLAGDDKAHTEHVYVWMSQYEPEIVDPGVLRVHAH